MALTIKNVVLWDVTPCLGVVRTDVSEDTQSSKTTVLIAHMASHPRRQHSSLMN
jgi:hypothetical protein